MRVCGGLLFEQITAVKFRGAVYWCRSKSSQLSAKVLECNVIYFKPRAVSMGSEDEDGENICTRDD